MNTVRSITLRNIKLNKKRTFVTLIGIILSTALICCVASFVSSIQKTLINRAIENNGYFHTTFTNVKKEKIKYIAKNNNVESYFLERNIGYAKYDKIENIYKPYIFIQGLDNYGFNNYGISLIAGRLPKNSSELIISNTINSNGNASIEIGDTLELAVGDRLSLNGNILNQYDSLYKNNEEEISSEKLKVNFKKKYKVVGFIERLPYTKEAYNSPGYTAFTKAIKLEEYNSISVIYKDINKTYNNTTDIQKDNNLDEKYSFNNESWLDYTGSGLSGNTLQTIVPIAVIVIIIIVVSSIFVIKNGFNISVTEKTKQYGILSSVGATKKQLKKIVLYEAFLIGVIGIIIGIISGLLATYILLQLVKLILKDSLGDIHLIFYFNYVPILITTIVSLITIYLSCIIPAHKASKTSPIDSIKQVDDIKVKNNKLKTNKLISKVFKIGGTIAHKNLKRSKKKYRTTVISIVISIVMFISISSFIEYGFKLSNLNYAKLEYNVELHLSTDKSQKENNKEIIKKISSNENIDRYSVVNTSSIVINDCKYLTKEVKKMGYDEICQEIDNRIQIASVDNKEYKNFLNKIGGNKKVKDKVIILDYSYMYDSKDEKTKLYKYYDLDSNDTIKINSKTNFTVYKSTDKRPLGLEKGFNYSPVSLLVTEDQFSKLNLEEESITMYINSTTASKLVKNIKEEINSKNRGNIINIVNLEEYKKENDSTILIISIFLYGFITVITLIGITNIFNTITTNMNLRKKEFAMLKSIGMTKKEFNRMINLECIFYCSKSLIIGNIIGCIFSYLIYKATTNTLEQVFVLPYKAIIISIIFVFLLIFIIMHYQIKKINKQNIIETIRNDNI